ncbi:hypothetical protein [Pseudonocardia adelaidensis]|uniref:hypothetical protein n=1 Tax=Pseudonocardia adelaidensis TaxID=648754 RepID=UPI0031E608C8
MALGVAVARVEVTVPGAAVVAVSPGWAIPTMTMIATIVPKMLNAIFAGLGTIHRFSGVG